MKTQKTLAIVSTTLALACSAFAAPAFAQDIGELSFAGPAATGPAPSRAEVEADRNLWLQSGLGDYAGNASGYENLPGYIAGQARYRAARSGPAYIAELRRVQGGDAAAVARGQSNTRAE